ncbi:hypothetical protein AQJ11_34505 [Streptomyces corchorusii]|uniref:Short-chain dehydrogenase n=1 Tax=Streptomyces corchorusii TaxID=1903 RepID=A0A101PVR2_STRCK|nr:hypothetical protein AQJ11_34505 [Streptomyces corchorusii]
MRSQSLAALVTGGASGIGPATARLLTDEGARVAVLDVAAQAPGEFAAHLNGGISDDASVVAAVRDAVRALGGLDVLVDNAGIGAQDDVEDNSDEEWHRVLDMNVVGMVRVTRAALPALRASAHAAIAEPRIEAELVHHVGEQLLPGQEQSIGAHRGRGVAPVAATDRSHSRAAASGSMA